MTPEAAQISGVHATVLVARHDLKVLDAVVELVAVPVVNVLVGAQFSAESPFDDDAMFQCRPRADLQASVPAAYPARSIRRAFRDSRGAVVTPSLIVGRAQAAAIRRPGAAPDPARDASVVAALGCCGRRAVREQPVVVAVTQSAPNEAHEVAVADPAPRHARRSAPNRQGVSVPVPADVVASTPASPINGAATPDYSTRFLYWHAVSVSQRVHSIDAPGGFR